MTRVCLGNKRLQRERKKRLAPGGREGGGPEGHAVADNAVPSSFDTHPLGWDGVDTGLRSPRDAVPTGTASRLRPACYRLRSQRWCFVFSRHTLIGLYRKMIEFYHGDSRIWRNRGELMHDNHG